MTIFYGPQNSQGVDFASFNFLLQVACLQSQIRTEV